MGRVLGRIFETAGGYLGVAAIVIALIAIAIALLVARRRYGRAQTLFKGVEAQIARTKTGDMRIVLDELPGKEASFAVRGRAIANPLKISIYNEELESWTSRNLVDAKTGAVSLSAHLCTLRPFIAKSYDDYEFETRPRIRFRLRPDETAIKHALANQDFDQSFKARVESAFREEIASRDDKAVGRDRSGIHAGVLKRMRELEELTPLGVDYLEVMSALIKRTQNPHRDYVLAQVAAGGSATQTGAAPTAFGPMDHSVPELDSIRDMFLVDGWTDPEQFTPAERMAHFDKSNQLLIRMLELQTRQNIAQQLAGAGKLMVLSTDDVGLSQDALLSEAQYARAMAPEAETSADEGRED